MSTPGGQKDNESKVFMDDNVSLDTVADMRTLWAVPKEDAACTTAPQLYKINLVKKRAQDVYDSINVTSKKCEEVLSAFRIMQRSANRVQPLIFGLHKEAEIDLLYRTTKPHGIFISRKIFTQKRQNKSGLKYIPGDSTEAPDFSSLMRDVSA
jgi:hypothetical protein